MIENGQEVANVADGTDGTGFLPYQGEDWDTLTGASHQVEGSELVTGDFLVGVPFVAVEATIRPGDYTHKDCGHAHPYMYVTAVVGNEHALKRAEARGRLAKENAEMLEPGEVVGFNEAGTGIFRQMLKYFESQGFVTLPEGPADGPFGESRFDSLPADWNIQAGHVSLDNDGDIVWTLNYRLTFPRGLRVSEYQNEFTKEGKTRYAA